MPELSHTPEQGAAAFLLAQRYLQTLQCALLLLTSQLQKQPFLAQTSIWKHYCNTKLLGSFYPAMHAFLRQGCHTAHAAGVEVTRQYTLLWLTPNSLAQEYHGIHQKIPAIGYCFLSRFTDPVTPGSLGAGTKKARISYAAKINVSREQPLLQWTTAEEVSPQGPLQAKHTGSCCPESLLLTGTTRFPSRLPGCPQTVPTPQGAAAWAQQCQTVTDRVAGPLGAPASSTQTAQVTLQAAAHFQTLSQWNGTFFPRITVPIHLLSKLQVQPGATTAHISPSKRVHK